MSTRWPAHVKRTAVTTAEGSGAARAIRLRPPPSGRTAVGTPEERERRSQEDREIHAWGAVVDVPDVELDPVRPRERGAAVDLGPAGEPGPHLEAAALVLVVLLDLVAERRPRADDAHVAANHIPELRQLVDGGPAQEAPDARDPRVAQVDCRTGAHPLRAFDHRPELEHLEVLAVPADPRLPVEDRTTVPEPRRHCGSREDRARENEPRSRDRDVERAVDRGAFAVCYVCGVSEG